jgi:serine protease Do
VRRARHHRSCVACPLLACLLAAGSALRAQGAASSPRVHDAAAASLSTSFESVVSATAPAVVQIVASGYVLADPDAPGPRREVSTGSGIVIDPSGWIVTNAHVVAGAREVSVAFPSPPAGGTRAPRLAARIVGVDRLTDVAVLKVEASGLAALPLPDSVRVRTGDLVLAFGAPLGLANSVTMGIVSAVDRELEESAPIGYIQTDAAINPGNSGGALVDVRGRVIGMNTLILSRSGGNEGIGLAIPVAELRRISTDIRRTGRVRRGIIGVALQPVSSPLADALRLPSADGLVISDLVAGGPAEVAGLEVGDVIVTADGVAINSARRFGAALHRYAGETQVTLGVLHDGTRRELRVPIVDEPEDPSAMVDAIDPEANRVPELGVLAATLDSAAAARVSGLRYGAGVVIAAVPEPEDDPGARFEPGDVIHAVNFETVQTLDRLRERLRTIPRRAPVVAWVERDGRGQFVTLRRH